MKTFPVSKNAFSFKKPEIEYRILSEVTAIYAQMMI